MSNVYITSYLNCFLNQNFIYASKDKDAELKVIDFGLSDFISPGTITCKSKKKSVNYISGP